MGVLVGEGGRWGGEGMKRDGMGRGSLLFGFEPQVVAEVANVGCEVVDCEGEGADVGVEVVDVPFVQFAGEEGSLVLWSC